MRRQSISVEPSSKRYYKPITLTNSEKILRMSTLGVSISRINYASGGLNPPRTRPRAGLIFILYGTLDVGFVAMTFFGVTCELLDGVLS